MGGYIKKFLESKPIYNHRNEWCLIIAGFLFILLRLPSLIEPYWYGDEGIYQVIGHGLNNGLLLYRDIWDNKPPLLYVLYALLHSNLYVVKFASLLFGFFSIIPFFLIAQKILNVRKYIYFSTIFFAVLLGSPLLEGNIANAENFMILPTLWAVYLVLNYSEKKKLFYLVVAGALLSVAFLTKIVAAFDFITLSIFILVLEIDSITKFDKKEWGRHLKIFIPSVVFGFSFLSFFIVASIYFLTRGAFLDFYQAVLSQNIDYVGDQNHFILPMGRLIIKFVLLFSGLIFLIVRRKSIGNNMFFLYLWMLLSLFSSFFSQRPYIHYLLVLLPSFCLLVGFIFRYKRNIYFGSLIALSIVLISYFYFKVYTKIIGYYSNYIQFVFDGKTVDEYQSFFDSYTPRDYEIARFIKRNTENDENIFIWSDNAQIYALADKLPPGKYTVAYHITFYKNAVEDTYQQIEKKQPRYIIQTKDSPELKSFLKSFILRYKMSGVNIYEREI